MNPKIPGYFNLVSESCARSLLHIERKPTSITLKRGLLRHIQVDVNGLRLQILLETLFTTLSPKSALLPTTERRLWRGTVGLVNANSASLNGMGNSQSSRDIRRENSS
jgi:hypothetical protein